jgi:hypothetical protein
MGGHSNEIEIYSIPKSDEERRKWPQHDAICSRCGQPFGTRKMRRLPDGSVVHKTCPEKGIPVKQAVYEDAVALAVATTFMWGKTKTYWKCKLCGKRIALRSSAVTERMIDHSMGIHHIGKGA